MVLRCNLHIERIYITYGLVAAVVPKLEFGCARAGGKPDDLLPQADAKERHARIQNLAHGVGELAARAAGILVDTPVAPGAAVSLDALAARGPLRAVNPGWSRYDTLTYQPGVVAGGTLVMSGFGALDPATQLAVHDGDLLAQAAYVYDNIDLVAAGATVTRLVEYVTPAGLAGHPKLAALRAERYPGAAVTSVVCSALLRPEFLIEVVPTAVLA